MKITMNELAKTLSDAAFKYRNAVRNRIMVNQEQERLKNILINNLDDIVEALEEAGKADEKIRMLETEIEDADAELAELDKQLKEARKPAPAKAKPKAKAEPDVE